MTNKDIRRNLEHEASNWIERCFAEDAHRMMERRAKEERRTMQLLLVSAFLAVALLMVVVGIATGVL